MKKSGCSEAVSMSTSRFQRSGAVPKANLKVAVWFSLGGVQTLDETAHQVRKLMFLSLMTEASIRRVYQLTLEQWRLRASQYTVRMATIPASR